jgi:hypothetical protein
LLDAGEGARVTALAEADVAAARAYAREAMEATGAWSVARIEAALRDPGIVPTWHTPQGCAPQREWLSMAGVDAAIAWPDRKAMVPVLRAWGGGRYPVGLAKVIVRRWDEAWIETDRLREILADPSATANKPAMPESDVHVAAAFALAHRGERVSPQRWVHAARSDDPWVARIAVETLDRLEDAQAWRVLAPKEPHLAYRVCVEPWRCEDHCVHIASCEEHDGRVCASVLRLGAHVAPDEAAPVIDADAHGAWAVTALPPRLFAPRARGAVCASKWWDPWTEEEQQAIRDLAVALAKIPKRIRCAALRIEEDGCVGPVDARAFAISAELASGCGIDPPEPTSAGAGAGGLRDRTRSMPWPGSIVAPVRDTASRPSTPFSIR